MILTIKDIARESGYSVSTVSRVLNNRRDVSPEARSRIMEVVELHNFVLNNNAKQLKQTASCLIAVIVKGTSNMLFSSIVEVIQKRIESTKYSVGVFYLDEDENEVEHALMLCREKKPQGILFLGGNPDYFKKGFEQVNVPCVLVTTESKELNYENLSSVSINDAEAAKCAVDCLFEQGHSKIGIIGGDPRTSYTSHLRLIGSMESFQEHGIMFDAEKYYSKARYSYASGYHAMERMMEKAGDVTAVFAMSDVMAIGAIRALRDRNLEIPEDVSVIGFDGTTLAYYYNPKLATVKQQSQTLATESVNILMNMIETDGGVVHESVPFELVTGESIKSLNKGGIKKNEK